MNKKTILPQPEAAGGYVTVLNALRVLLPETQFCTREGVCLSADPPAVNGCVVVEYEVEIVLAAQILERYCDVIHR